LKRKDRYQYLGNCTKLISTGISDHEIQYSLKKYFIYPTRCGHMMFLKFWNMLIQ